ncbi:MAG: hypothetical protein WAU91_17935 [Desulfatitalea sp.]
MLIGGPVRPTEAADTRIIPTVSLREDYNDNLFFTSEEEEEDYITTLTAGLIFFSRSERSRIDLSGAVAPFFYRDHNSLNETDADCRAAAMYRLTPVVSMNLNGTMEIDHRPDRDIDSTGLVFSTDRRDRYHARAQTNLALNETNGLEMAYDYDQDNWHDELSDRLDYDGHAVRLGYLYDIGPRLHVTQLTIDAGHGRYSYDTARMNSSYLSIGANRMLDELLRVRAYGGARYTDMEYDLVPEGASSDEMRENKSWNALGGIKMEYLGARTRCGLTLSHDLRPTSGTQGPSNLTRGILNVSRRLQEKFALGFSAGYFMNRAKADEYFADEIEQDTLSLRPYLRWQFFEHFALEGAYGYTALDDRTTDERTKRHTLYVQITFGYSLLDYLDVIASSDRLEYGGAYPRPSLR